MVIGRGKTFAYLLPLIQLLEEARGEEETQGRPSVLVVEPTIELASQIKHEADFLLEGSSPRLSSDLLTAAGGKEKQSTALRKKKPAVIIGNPARIVHLADERKLHYLNINQVYDILSYI
jgi:superfamily II DNA/RNA helicase